MATVTEVKKICDLTGGEAHETVTFALDGTGYEIDLHREQAGALRDELATFLAKARKVGKLGIPGGRSKSGRTSTAGANRDQTAAIREWARKNNLAVKDRGRIPAKTVAAFEDAHRPGVLTAAG